MKRSGQKKIFSGLSRQVFLWFLLISLIPMFLISWLSYQTARNQIFHDTETALLDVSNLQTRFFKANFERTMFNLTMEANRPSNSIFLSGLKKSFHDSGRPLNEFVNSYRWMLQVEENVSHLESSLAIHGYHDILLLDDLGNILFTFARESDLGINLFQGDLSKSRFALAAKESLESGKIVFSDMERYKASGGILTGFLIEPVLNEFGEKIGLIAFQLSAAQVHEFVGQGYKFGESGRRYLIGPDLTLRTPGALGDAFSVLKQKVETKNTSEWLGHVASEPNRTEHNSPVFSTYEGPNGQHVLGVHATVDLAGVKWGYIAEINEEEALDSSNKLAKLTVFLITITIFIVFFIAIALTRHIVLPIVEISGAFSRVGAGDLDQTINESRRDELGELARGFNEMIVKLKTSYRETETNNWLREGNRKLNNAIQGDLSLENLAGNAISFLCNYLGAQIGAFYAVRGKKIKLVGSYAFHARKGFNNEFGMGDGMVGQAALEKKTLILSELPDDYLAISSGLGETTPKTISIIPLIWNDKVIALLEFGKTSPFNALHERLLEMISTTIATAVQTSMSRDRTQKLLEQTQAQTEELRVREEELSDNNRLLEEQSQTLKQSQIDLEQKNEQLQGQQEELSVANEELENRAGDLNQSRGQLEKNNQFLEDAKQELEKRADELAIASKYKSEFLANMSHELRTPLNSLLILSKLLTDNKGGNLTEKQVDYSRTIFDSGNELQSLINDILDLAKIESGKTDVIVETIFLDDFVSKIHRKFVPMTENKGISFTIDSSGAPDTWDSDSQKLDQIVKNLLANAIKFTEKGQVSLTIGSLPEDISIRTSGLNTDNALAFMIKDSGIGIPKDKLNIIFEAFQQADGTTSRKHGGTGLGLSISRELAKLLGGEIHVKSEEGRGSIFSLILPAELIVADSNKADEKIPAVSTSWEIPPKRLAQSSIESDTNVVDDRHKVKPGNRSILIIEDDTKFAAIVADVARERGFKVLVAEDGKTGLHFADFYQPSGIVLDIGLPGMDGCKVMEHLKDNLKTRHIPVHFMSAFDNLNSIDAMKKGAVGFLTKPVSLNDMGLAFERIETVINRSVKRLLLVEDNPNQQISLGELIASKDVEVVLAETGSKAEKLLLKQHFDCIVLDLGLPDMSGLDFLENLRTKDELRQVPVVVYTGKELESKERAILDQYAQSIIIKDVRSPERLLDDTALFLHRLESELPEEQHRTIQMLHDSELIFEGRKVLVVDDDMRNTFSLTAVLHQKNMKVLTGINGIEALEKLDSDPDIDIVLMDIMMPEMDGYEAIRKIREQARFKNLPVIALTAKAMKGDRALCIEAGANDYVAKPINTDKLMSVMRVWLFR